MEEEERPDWINPNSGQLVSTADFVETLGKINAAGHLFRSE